MVVAVTRLGGGGGGGGCVVLRWLWHGCGSCGGGHITVAAVVMLCHGGCMAWRWQAVAWLGSGGGGRVAAAVVMVCRSGCGMAVAAVVAVTSRWQQQSCYVMMAAWHGSGRWSYGLVVVAAVALWWWQQLCHVMVAAWHGGGGSCMA